MLRVKVSTWGNEMTLVNGLIEAERSLFRYLLVSCRVTRLACEMDRTNIRMAATWVKHIFSTMSCTRITSAGPSGAEEDNSTKLCDGRTILCMTADEIKIMKKWGNGAQARED
jgi:hypothetical protein